MGRFKSFRDLEIDWARVTSRVLATSLYKCTHIMAFYALWATLVTVLNHRGHGLWVESTMLTAMGLVVGFSISYRTSSAFERYNEGKLFWSRIIASSRMFARGVWIYVADPSGGDPKTLDERKARSYVEKKTVINLVLAYAVSLKHHLRGEKGIYYEDLYEYVKFLPDYVSKSSFAPTSTNLQPFSISSGTSTDFGTGKVSTSGLLPLSATTPTTPSNPLFMPPGPSRASSGNFTAHGVKLAPIKVKPSNRVCDFFPISLLLDWLHVPKGEKGRKKEAKKWKGDVSHSLPLEISFYLVPMLTRALAQLVDTLAGLERVQRMPIPASFILDSLPASYRTHLWTVTSLYCLALPPQIWAPLGWITIPATIVVSFLFFGFILAGEEIEDPFGYDPNDLDLDHLTNDIIRNELRAITSRPPPEPSVWAFMPGNDSIFESVHSTRDVHHPPEYWVSLGYTNTVKELNMHGMW
ncbi:UPF0187-domain-containing protein [Pluteus cervinus]|uniref:UPF0187-domain-containing protein n=1 Tax=Pluteus cervinus TaxID=181527 RepID=A0ACD3A859_9AGAR|nr:UPF0187-domain-containing protein [Pluteus cervinus]